MHRLLNLICFMRLSALSPNGGHGANYISPVLIKHCLDSSHMSRCIALHAMLRILHEHSSSGESAGHEQSVAITPLHLVDTCEKAVRFISATIMCASGCE